jgi:hypothetical protein
MLRVPSISVASPVLAGTAAQKRAQLVRSATKTLGRHFVLRLSVYTNLTIICNVTHDSAWDMSCRNIQRCRPRGFVLSTMSWGKVVRSCGTCCFFRVFSVVVFCCCSVVVKIDPEVLFCQLCAEGRWSGAVVRTILCCFCRCFCRCFSLLFSVVVSSLTITLTFTIDVTITIIYRCTTGSRHTKWLYHMWVRIRVWHRRPSNAARVAGSD